MKVIVKVRGSKQKLMLQGDIFNFVLVKLLERNIRFQFLFWFWSLKWR